MSQFSGRQGDTTPKGDRKNKGVMRERRAVKQSEAVERNQQTPHERTRRHRLDKCDPGEHLLQEIFTEPPSTDTEALEPGVIHR